MVLLTIRPDSCGRQVYISELQKGIYKRQNINQKRITTFINTRALFILIPNKHFYRQLHPMWALFYRIFTTFIAWKRRSASDCHFPKKPKPSCLFRYGSGIKVQERSIVRTLTPIIKYRGWREIQSDCGSVPWKFRFKRADDVETSRERLLWRRPKRKASSSQKDRKSVV